MSTATHLMNVLRAAYLPVLELKGPLAITLDSGYPQKHCCAKGIDPTAWTQGTVRFENLGMRGLMPLIEAKLHSTSAALPPLSSLLHFSHPPKAMHSLSPSVLILLNGVSLVLSLTPPPPHPLAPRAYGEEGMQLP